jgi:hypothetical protein
MDDFGRKKITFHLFMEIKNKAVPTSEYMDRRGSRCCGMAEQARLARVGTAALLLRDTLQIVG